MGIVVNGYLQQLQMLLFAGFFKVEFGRKNELILTRCVEKFHAEATSKF